MDSDIMEWKNEEIKHLRELSKIEQLKIEEITYLLNDKHNNARTTAQVMDEIKTFDNLVSVVPNVPEPKRKMKKGWSFKEAPNARKSWVTADDKYLLENWTADTKIRNEVAEHLGRSIASCSTRTSVLKHKPELKEYYLTLIAGGLHTSQQGIHASAIGTMALTPTDVNGQITIDTEAKIVTTELSHLLVGVTPDEYTLLDKIYHWFKTRQARKQMNKADREKAAVKKMKLQKQIDSLQKELKTVGR